MTLKIKNNLNFILLLSLVLLSSILFFQMKSSEFLIEASILFIIFIFAFVFLFVSYKKEIFIYKNKSNLYKNILQLASDNVFILDDNGKVIEFSENTATTLGYTIEEFKTLKLFDFDKSIKKDEYVDILKGLTNVPITFERTHTRKDGTNFLVQITATKLNIEGENYFYSSSRDITEIKKHEAMLDKKNKEQSNLLSLFDNSNMVLYRLNLKENDSLSIEYISKSVENVLGYTKDEIIKSNVSYFDFVHDNDYSFVKTKIEEMIKTKESKRIKPYRIVTKNNEEKWLLNHTIVETDTLGMVTHLLGISLDITKEQMTLQNLKKFINNQENIVVLTNGKEINFANKKFYSFFGIKNLKDFENSYENILSAFIENERFFSKNKVKDIDTWVEQFKMLPDSKKIVTMMGQDFKLYAFSISINDFDNKNYIISFSDISETMLEKIELEEKTIYDKLTQAYNREYLEKNFYKILQEYKESGFSLALAFLDIDHFKNVNDTYGHDIGDEVLIHFVNTIEKNSRPEDILVRWGGEEFIFLVKIDTNDNLFQVLDTLRIKIQNEPFDTIGKLTCSIGAIIHSEENSIEFSIKKADESVYEAKAKGRNQVKIT